jgi:addiction module RelB/DinJ family antitoxin
LDTEGEAIVTASAAQTERVNFRANKTAKHEAERVLRAMGLNLSDGLNMFLARVAAEHRVPFQLAMTREEVLGADALALGTAVTGSIRAEVQRSVAAGAPVARFDRESGRAYVQYGDGRKEYLDG